MVRRDLELVGSDFGSASTSGSVAVAASAAAATSAAAPAAVSGPRVSGLGGEGSLEFLARRGFDLVQGGFLED